MTNPCHPMTGGIYPYRSHARKVVPYKLGGACGCLFVLTASLFHLGIPAHHPRFFWCNINSWSWLIGNPPMATLVIPFLALDILINHFGAAAFALGSVNQCLPWLYGSGEHRKGCWKLDGKSWVPKLSHRASARENGGGLVLLVGLLLCLIGLVDLV